MNIPTNLRYSKEHEWVRLDGEMSVIGITDYAQDALGDIVFLELPAVGSAFRQGEALGVVESVKAVSDIYAPISGEVVAVNEPLLGKPETINSDPYGEGWMVKMKQADAGEINQLLDPAAYQQLLAEESE